ncbi:hypothetical protein XA68_18012 [Ophiocordyceps unilateralis]|uniref:Aminoacyl-transfer RNA synthetases class-II family profile domain-containing protein n=1 Tax=Ophiocordyceps unilateralis TaxID=268505 RepID=A0A2A9PK55_OPHUN|nr:hypothetical protein XA68_18012 [Ophiocordyceps unilateralis]
MLRPGRRGVALCSAHQWSIALLRRHFSISPGEQEQGLKELTPGQAYARRVELLRLWHLYQRPENSHADSGSSSSSSETYVGFLGKRRDVGKHLSFSNLTTPAGEVIQLCVDAARHSVAHFKFRAVPDFSPVRVRVSEEEPELKTELGATNSGAKQTSDSPAKQASNSPEQQTSKSANKSNQSNSKRSLLLNDIRPLNSVPNNWLINRDIRFSPAERHLQIRFHPELQARLRFRSWLKGELNRYLLEKQFVEVETPTLFKSTAEGAREFLVPTRRQGTAYALSQSPQQYKQVLMASGILRYMQWARCYRDEDARTDRQPEFTQLDLEWAFHDAAAVMEQVSSTIGDVLHALHPAISYGDIRNTRIPIVAKIPQRSNACPVPTHRFTTITFTDSIAAYGTDKPDLRIPDRIYAIGELKLIRQFVDYMTRLPDPVIEFFILRPDILMLKDTRRFVRKFMTELPPAFDRNPDGKPEILICDSSLAWKGFSWLGRHYSKIINSAMGRTDFSFEVGDLVVFQARAKPAPGHMPSSTMIGNLRRLLWTSLVEEGYMPQPRLGEPESLQFVWVTEFPLFKPSKRGEPGQGEAGLSCSHHPFTAPLSETDLNLLFTEPLAAKSAAYDLVLNGVEIGGGSQRNHIADIQIFIMRDIMQMSEEKMAGFRHLLAALRSGCPPHAGFALGFDRLVALLCDTRTVRDVLAFPKTMKGEDPFVQAPGKLTDEQLIPYGLELMTNRVQAV